MNEHFKNYPGFENLPSLAEMQNNISLFLVDNHFSLSYSRPYLPNAVDFGGLSVNTGEKLPAVSKKVFLIPHIKTMSIITILG